MVGTYDMPAHFMMLDLPQASTFSGAATYSYPLDLPAGRNGMAPALSLDYSSGMFNGLAAAVQSNYVGLGWNLGGMPSIVRKMKSSGVGFENDFTLALGGVGYKLMGPAHSTSTDTGCRYYAEGAPQLKVMRYTQAGSNHEYCGYDGGPTPTNQGGEYWTVTTADGTLYRMGFTANSELIPENDGFEYDPTGDPPDGPEDYVGSVFAFKWAADVITDVHGNTTTFGYYEDTLEEICLELTSSCDGFAQFQKSQIPDWIRYTGDESGAGVYLVDFVLEDRTTGNDTPTSTDHDDGLDGEEIYWEYCPGAMWDSKRVGSIRVCTTSGSTNTCASSGIIAEYDLDYQFVEEVHPGLKYLINTIGHETTRLVQITKVGWASSTVSQSLPTMTFDYGIGTQAIELDHDNDSLIQVTNDSLTYPRLFNYANGYGTTVALQYALVEHNDMRNRRVSQRTVGDGMGNYSVTQYAYEGACFSDDDTTDTCIRWGEDENDGLIGHSKTTVSVYDYDSGPLLQKTATYYHKQPGPLQGKPYRTEVYDGNTVLRTQETVWAASDIDPSGLGATAGYAAQTRSTNSFDNPQITYRTDTVHDLYGNAVSEYARAYQVGASQTVTNAGFESGITGWVSFWSPYPSGSVTSDAAHSGTYSLKLANADHYGGAFQDIGNLTEGRAYTIRAWTKAEVEMTSRLQLWVHDTDATTVGDEKQGSWYAPPTEWQQIETTYVAPSNGNLRLHFFLSPGDGAVYIDDVTITEEEADNAARSVHREYLSHTDEAWFVGLPSHEAVFDGICEPDEINVLFTNDLKNASGDRNLYVDYVEVDGKVIQAEGGRMVVDKYATVTASYFDGADVLPGQEIIAWNAALRTRTTGPYSTGSPQIVIRAKGTPADSVYPSMQVRVNGAVITTTTVTANWQTYTVTASLGNCGQAASRSFTYYDDTSGDIDAWGESEDIDTGTVTMQAQGLLGVSGEPTATTRLGYDAWGNTVVITDALGHVVTTTYDSSYHQYPVATCAAVGTADELCTETEYYGVNETATTGDYGLFGQVQRTIDANDQAMHYVYDAFGTSVRVKYPDDAGFGDGQVSERTSYHFEGTIGQQRYIARQGRDATWQEVYYDGLGRVIQAHQYAEAGQEIRTTTGYDALGRAVRQWTPTYGTHSEDGGYGSYGYVPASPALPQTITFYDTLGQTSRDPDGGTANAFQIGSRSIAVDANGHRRDSIADGLRRVVEVIEYPNDPEVIEGEDTLEYCTGEIDIGSVRLSPSAGTGVCWMSYGPYETPEEEGPGQVVRFRLAIDSLSGGDDLIATIDVNDYTAGHVSLASRDLYRSDFVGGLWNFTDFPLVFDTTGRGSNQLEYRVKWQNTARLSHDRTELIWTSDPITTTYAYDTLDNLTVVTDTLGNATRMTYDGLGRKVEMVDPDMGRWTYAYDAGGNLVTQIDAKLQATDFYYNARNELTGKAYALGVNPAGYTRPGTPTTYAAQYGYDESGHGESLGRRTTMTDTSGSTSWTYDTRGRVTQEVKVIDTETFTTTMTYNSLDQVVTTTYPDGEVVTNTYNAATQPVSLTSSLDDYVTGATYEATGALADLVLGNGLTTTYSYDPRTARLTGLRTGELLNLHYMYDRVGNVRSLYDVTEDEIQTFDYDALDRLTAAHYGDYDAEIADGFGSSTLGNDWEAYVPVSEPTYSLTARSGYLRLSATSGTPYDHWTAADSALQIRTVGSMTETIAGDWSLETKLDLTTYTTDQPFQTGLMVYFGQYDIAYWGPHGGTRLRLERSGEAGILQVDNTATTVWLRVRKVGTSYVFEYETSANGDWVTAGQAEWGGIPERVGVILKTWGTTGATTTADFDYVNLAGIGDDTMRSYTYDAVGNLTSKTGAGVYTYTTSLGLTGCMTGTPTTKPHAVRETGSYGPFGYDCNGNMTERTMGSDTYALTYSVENKLVTATTGVTTTSYLYDGDGVLVMKTDPDGVTRYVGEHYEELSTTAGDTTIGEVGQLTVTDTHQVVPLSRSYTDPVVFVQPASYNESDPTVARLVSVQGDRFTVKLQDAPNKTQTHAAESVSYLVFEAGAWDLPGGGMIEVGALDTSATQGASPASWTTVSFSDTFASTPVILSQVQTYSDTHWVKTRQTSASTSGFSVALEEDEAQTSPHGAETVGWLAITAGSGTWNGHAYMAGQTGNSVNGNWYSLSLSGFTAAPRFLASLATQRSSDSAHVRYQSLTSTNVQVKAEEDTTADGETGHTPEAVAYLAIQGDGTLTAATGGASTTTVTKYYYLGGQRVAMRVATETTWIHGDHLGSASLTTDDTGSSVGQMRYYPYGETRGTGSVATDRRYTGQREDYYTQLVQMGVRWYDADLARWTSPDSIVPAPANPQSLNRYTYVYGNPLAYTDPDGHFPWLIVGGVALLGSVATRLGSEYLGSRITGVDRARRDQVGGALVLDYSAVIEREAAAHSVDPVSVGAVLRFESAAVERRAFAAYPGSQPGLFSNGFEALQTVLPSEWSNEWMRFGDMASIGPGQMQLRRALELEEMGYVSRRGSTEERRSALLGRATSIEYVAGMLHYLADQLSAYPEYSALSGEGQQRLQLIAYNWGWTDSFESRLQELGLQGMIDWWGYDDSLLDGYGQWEAGQ